VCHSRRLFFALWPDNSIRQQIKSAPYPHLKPRTTPLENWHMTLVFLGPTLPEQQDRLEHAAATVRAKPFTLSLDITGQFARAQVAWLGCRHPRKELVALQGELESALSETCPEHPAFASVVRPYCPHVTLYRHVYDMHVAEEIEPVYWPVSSFCLIESRPADRPIYRVINSWDLTA
jgi:2'-5' RNA ligase